MTNQQSGAVKSAARALDLLDAIAFGGPGTQQQLGVRLGVPKSSMHALLRTMLQRGWLETDPTGTVYRLGIHSLVVSSAFLDADSAVSRAQAYIDELSALTGETVHLGRLAGREVVYTAKRESTHPLRMFSAVGRRLSACSTALGRAVLAQRTLAEREELVPDEIVALTPRTTTDRPLLMDMLERASRDGYAVESEESCLGVRCFAVSVPFSPAEDDALGLAIPMSRLGDEREVNIVEALLGIRARVAEESYRLRGG